MDLIATDFWSATRCGQFAALQVVGILPDLRYQGGQFARIDLTRLLDGRPLHYLVTHGVERTFQGHRTVWFHVNTTGDHIIGIEAFRGGLEWGDLVLIYRALRFSDEGCDCGRVQSVAQGHVDGILTRQGGLL